MALLLKIPDLSSIFPFLPDFFQMYVELFFYENWVESFIDPVTWDSSLT